MTTAEILVDTYGPSSSPEFEEACDRYEYIYVLVDNGPYGYACRRVFDDGSIVVERLGRIGLGYPDCLCISTDEYDEGCDACRERSEKCK